MIVMLAATAHADDLCRRPARGPTVDLDVKDADVHDVLRLVTDVARVNLVVSDEVAGKVTLRLKRVRWEQVACAIAKLEHLTMSLDQNVLLVTSAARRSSADAARP